MLVLAEGLFMYLPFGDIQMLVRRLQERCGTAELVAEVFNRRWLHPLFRWVVDRKLQRALGVGSETRFLSGLRRSREMEDWGPGIEYVDDWSVFDDPEPGLGIVRVLAPLDFVRRSLWVVRYRLQRAPTP